MRYPWVIRCSARQAKRMEPKVRAERKGKESNRYEGKEKKKPVKHEGEMESISQNGGGGKGVQESACMALHCIA